MSVLYSGSQNVYICVILNFLKTPLNPDEYMDEQKERLKQIIKDRSILKGSFTLSSGEQSSYYVDARLTTLDPEGVNIISKILLNEILKDPGITTAGGPTLGADPIVGSLISLSWELGFPLNGFIVRKKNKEHGTSRLIEGNLKKGDQVAMLEDVITSGGSVLSAIEAAEDSGGIVKKVLCVVDREQGAGDLLSERGYEYYSIFSISELL